MGSYESCKASEGDVNVRRAFRLEDSQKGRGVPIYELSCEQNQLLMLLKSGRYNVVFINYKNSTIRVRDTRVVESDHPSLPGYSLTDLNFSYWDDPYSPTIIPSVFDGVYVELESNQLTRV
ncbi:uncharacterized protein LOC114731296 [Neltuma alba]|uniref:uncharacterized protein LOC114731296 n=1 Tax=Neltuma alba TaxID=207710 RepID=UPI0010A3EDDE|nr:uncharacterized protein LOC114731296 [Prosopis alba]